MPDITINDNKIFYDIRGKGDNLILLHNGFHSSKTWDSVIDELSENYRVIAYDRYGYGNSEHLDGMIESDIVEDGVEELAILIEELGLERVNFIGHCLGGAIALLYTAKYPDKVDKVVAASVGYYSDEKLLFKSDWTFRPFEQIPLPLQNHLTKMHGESYALKFWEIICDYKNAYIMDSNYTIVDRIKGIKNEIMIMNGDSDFYFDIDHPLSVYKKIKNAAFCIIPRAGHDIHIEKKTEFLTAVNTFLDK